MFMSVRFVVSFLQASAARRSTTCTVDRFVALVNRS